MCGIAGFELQGGDAAARAQALNAQQSCRGPDGHWFAEHDGYGLAQTRLAIIDLDVRMKYPLGNEDRTLWLLFNGEIYDHAACRADLERRGHRFQTACDAEVVLHAYEEWGLEGIAGLNGMYALALVDERRHEIVLARDPVGIKPLVRTTIGRFAFASDAIALVCAGLSRGEIDQAAIEEYAAFHYVPHPGTGITGIEQVEPGTAVRRLADGSEETVRFATSAFAGSSTAEPVGLEQLDAVVGGAVARQLVADVDVGVFLSGGLDSALVLAYAVEAGARPSAFTIGFSGYRDFDERPRAAELARAMGVQHHVREFRLGFGDAITAVSDAYDTPFADASSLASLLLARLAREHVAVALSGTGADDLFGGYARHRIHLLSRPLKLVPTPILELMGRGSIDLGGERRSALALARSYVSRLASTGGEDFERYLSLVGTHTSRAGCGALVVGNDLESARRRVAGRIGFDQDDTASFLRRLQRFELATYLPGDLLVKEDRATMAVGLEGRVPMLDAEMLALAGRVPDSQKVNLLGGKRFLRALARKRLPGSSGSGRKRGFAVPLADLFAGPWRREAVSWLDGLESTLVDGAATAKLVTRTPSVATDVWALVALAAWEARLRHARVGN